MKNEMREMYEPDNTVRAFANRKNRRFVLGGDFEEIAEDVVLDESSAVARIRRNIIRRLGWLC